MCTQEKKLSCNRLQNNPPQMQIIFVFFQTIQNFPEMKEIVFFQKKWNWTIQFKHLTEKLKTQEIGINILPIFFSDYKSKLDESTENTNFYKQRCKRRPENWKQKKKTLLINYYICNFLCPL